MLVGLRTDCKLVDVELDRAFANGAPEPSQGVQGHLGECERCKRLYSYLLEELPSATIPREVQHRIVSTIQDSLKPVSRLRSTSTIVAQLIVTYLLIATAVTSMMKVAGIDAMRPGQLIGISIILAVGVALLSTSLAWQMKPGSLQRIPPPAAVAILATGLVVGILLLFPLRTPEAFLARGWRCLRAGLSMAMPAALVFGFIVRRGAPLSLGILGGTLGAIAGMLAVTVLQYTCDLQDIGHLLVWHGGVLAISTIFGWFIGRSVSRFRAR
jgi:hypothetical protein